MNVIRSHHHEVFTEQINKIALSADDDKREICDNKMKLLPTVISQRQQRSMMCELKIETPKDRQRGSGEDRGALGNREAQWNGGERPERVLMTSSTVGAFQ